MANSAVRKIVTGFLGKIVNELLVVTHVIVREFIGDRDNGTKSRLGKYQYVGIKAWRSNLESGKTNLSKFIGFKRVFSAGGTGRYVQTYSDSDLPVFLGDKEHSKLYKRGKLRVLYALSGEAEFWYLDEAGLLREGENFSDFVASKRGEYILHGVASSVKLNELEKQVIQLLDDAEYTASRARNRLTNEDCTISKVEEDGLHVTGLRKSSTGVCKVNSRVNHISLGEDDIGTSRVRVLDLSGCTELNSVEVSLKGVDSFSYIAPPTCRDVRLDTRGCKVFSFVGNKLAFNILSISNSKVTGFTEVAVKDAQLVDVTGLSAVSIAAGGVVTVSSCDLESLRVTGVKRLCILGCQRLKELDIEIDTLRLDDLSELVCNCRGLEKVVITANRVSYNIDSNAEGNPIVTATFGSVSLKRLEINVKRKSSIDVLPVPSDFVIGYDSKTEVVCNSEKFRAYFKPVKFSEGIQNLLCASFFARLFYVKDKVTVKFGTVSGDDSMAGSPLFKDGVFKIPSEVESLSGRMYGKLKIRALHISSKLDVGNNVFKHTDISEIVGSEYLTSIGSLAFAGTKLKRLSLGKEAKLGEFSFGGCESLTSVIGLLDIKGMKRTAFALCNNLDSDTLGVLYKKKRYISAEELLSDYSEREYVKYVSREIDSVITKDDCKYTQRLIALRIDEAAIQRFMKEHGVSREEKVGLKELLSIISNIYYTYEGKGISPVASYYVDLGTTERLIYSLKRVLEL